jgi:lincosamide nucleotidyltransferase A/C/D/E
VTSAEDVVELLDRLDAAGVWYCVTGGWGIDALLGEQTRAHDDLDLGVRLEDVELLCATLHEFGRDDGEWPSRLVLRDARGRQVDAHPLSFDAAGDGWQGNLRGDPYRWPREHLAARGNVAGRAVPCITAELQLRWHAYEGIDDVDWADVRALCDRCGLPVPAAFAAPPGFVAPKRLDGAR